MSNTSLYRVATIHTPIVLRSASRTMAMVRLLVTYLQYLLIRLELFVAESTLQAYMTPQVCYIEKMLQLHISPDAVIDPVYPEFILYQEGEAGGVDVFVSDAEDVMIYDDTMFGFAEFTVKLPYGFESVELYTRELINRYRLPGSTFTIIYR